MIQDYPHVGTAINVRKDGKVLMGLRSGKAAPGYWCAPGGKLEMNEDIYDSARRETKEEAGIEIADLHLIAVTNDMWPELDSHYLTLHFACDWKSGEVELREPDKFERWEWFAWDYLPKPLLLATQNFVDAGWNPFTAIAIDISSSAVHRP